jgi:hypothetical protein
VGFPDLSHGQIAVKLNEHFHRAFVFDEYHASLPRLEARASYAADLHSETAGAPLRRLPGRLD